MSPSLRLIVGLGNPGPDYAATRHNIGFMAVDEIADRYACSPWKKKFKGLIAAASKPNFVLLKPQTFMNLSGEAVADALRFHKLSPKDVIVFHDDLDVEPGRIKIKQGGGTGGHNGLKSMDAHIGQDYWRVRIGIGHPGVKGDVVTNYVLGAFAKADREWTDPLLDAVAAEFDAALDGNMDAYLKLIRLRFPAA